MAGVSSRVGSTTHRLAGSLDGPHGTHEVPVLGYQPAGTTGKTLPADRVWVRLAYDSLAPVAARSLLR